jgi:hypothetical protein
MMCGGKTAYEKTAVIPLGVKKSTSTGSMQAMRKSTDSGFPDDKGQLDYDSSNSNASNDGAPKDSKQSESKTATANVSAVNSNINAAPKAADVQSKMGISPEKANTGTAAKSEQCEK